MRELCMGLALIILVPGICLVSEAGLGPQAEGRNGVVVSGNSDSAAAGLEMLQEGGNAADAAVATILAESVANSDKFCFGGEVAILVYDANRAVVEAVCGIGATPRLATLEYFEEAGGIKGGTAQSAAVPAALDACVTLLDRYGTMTFHDAVQPALRMLDKGQSKWHSDLGRTLRRLTDAEKAAEGRHQGLRGVADCFYRGPIAREIDTWSRAHAGLIRYDDLAGHVTRIEPPLEADYRGFAVYKCGPWTQGPALLQALRILERFDAKAMGFQSPDWLHAMVEATKLAFADRDAYYGDPLHVEVPVSFLLSEKYTRTRRALIDMHNTSFELCPGTLVDSSAGGHEQPSGESPRDIRDTTTCLAADRRGNVVAATPSGWGGVLAGDTGIRLGSRLISFNTQRGHPNCIAPGKRPRTTLTPTIVLCAGKPVLAVSVAGGDTQEQASLQIVTNFIDFGLDAAALVSTPRYATEHYVGSFNQRPPILGGLTVDPRVGADMLDALRERGHKVKPTTVTGQERTVITIDRNTGLIRGAGDPEAIPPRAAAGW